MLNWIIAFYLPLTCLTQGVSFGGSTLTAAPVLSLLGCVLILIKRIRAENPIITLKVLAIPAVFCSIAYLAVGILSGVFAADKDSYIREVVQRTLIIWAPLYLYVYGPAHPRLILRAMFLFIPLGAAIAALTFIFALKSGLHEAIYLFGMHKNAVGADCAHLTLICGALFVTNSTIPFLGKKFKRYEKLILGSIMILGFLGMVGSQARAAMVGTIIGMFLMMAVNRVRPRYLIATALLFSCAFAGIVAVLPKEQIEHAVGTKKFSSNEVRQVTWQFFSKRLSEDPMMWLGWGNQISYNGKSAEVGGQFAQDGASIFYYDWSQMGILGVLAQFAMIGTCIFLPISNARRCPVSSPLSAINLAALGIMSARFEQSYLDTFWIGRGPTLATWAAVGMAVYVRLWLNQEAEILKTKFVTQASIE